MNRLMFFILLIVPSFFAGILIAYLDGQYGDKYFNSIISFWLIVYIPALLVLRMIKLKFTLGEIFQSIVPFWGSKLRDRIWFDK